MKIKSDKDWDCVKDCLYENLSTAVQKFEIDVEKIKGNTQFKMGVGFILNAIKQQVEEYDEW